MIDEEAVKAIEHLHRLKNEGILTEEEFEASKQNLLFGARRPLPRMARVEAQPSSSVPLLPAADDHVGWATLALKRYADFTGRSSRKEFWMFQLVPLGLCIIGIVLIGVAGENGYGGFNTFGDMTAVMLALALIGLIVPQVAAQIRRFHDQDRSGWFAALNLVPYVGPVIVLGLMLLDGTPGDNRHGPDPKTDMPPPGGGTYAWQKLWWKPRPADRE